MSQFTRTALSLPRLTPSRQGRRFASVLATHHTPRGTGIPPLGGMAPTQAKKPYAFRHQGPMPEAPQALDHLQFILGQKPLESPVAKRAEVRTAAEARERARQQLEELHMVVQNASSVMSALSQASEKYLQPKSKDGVIGQAGGKLEQRQADAASTKIVQCVGGEIAKAPESKRVEGTAAVAAAGSWSAVQQQKVARILLAVLISGSSLSLFVTQTMGL
ncbi:hypothetical protein EC988_001959 [Linderina pennispora]|nr:hypothetical protein EC988_001959 [Linderina pennispora]